MCDRKGLPVAVIGLVLFVLPFGNQARSDVSAYPWQGYQIRISISGTIKPSDYAALVAQVATAKSQTTAGTIQVQAFLDTNGGDVETAMRIGRLLRKEAAEAWVPQVATCVSACVLILAGAANRIVSGKVGIHRPFNPEAEDTTAAKQRDRYRKLGVAIKEYLEEMNVPSRLYDEMLYIDPANVRILTAGELAAYGLNKADPYWDEASAVRYARRLGISRAELLDRENRAQECLKSRRATPQTLSERMLADNSAEDKRMEDCYRSVMEGRR